jgi:hypothetical protein
LHRFPLAEPLWNDPDRQHVERMPKEYWSGLAWDAVDQTLFEPTNRALWLDLTRPAANVNAMDEVPDSSWFENRIGLHPMSPEEVARGSCPERGLTTEEPWTVVAAKPNGANPGFIIRAADGRGYLLKMDGLVSGERATTADVFGSKVYHAVGFHAPCNRVVFFHPDQLRMDPDAETEDDLGRDIPMTMEHVETVLSKATVAPDGRLRASASLFLSGRPLGPFKYQDRRRDDPNDVIRHQDRRELRGARILAAWLNHFDAREQNTLDMWVTEDGASYIKHHYIDFGDCLGSRWEQDGLSRRFGTSHYLDAGDILADWFSFGSIPRSWDRAEISHVAPILGYYDAASFRPERWVAGYPNPAFTAMQDGDAAWMARILARFEPEHLWAMLRTGQMSEARYELELYRTLRARLNKILEHYLRVRSPLTDFAVRGEGDEQRLCFVDLAARKGVVEADLARYLSRMYFGDFSEPAWTRREAPSQESQSAELCIDLVDGGQRPSTAAGPAAEDHPSRYAILDISVEEEPGREPLPPARLHFYDTAERGFQLVGIERPASDRPPADRGR